jgi:A/G-specific adenine glycosylase
MRRGAAFVVRNGNGAILLEKRPEDGLLGGMLQPPLSPWSVKFPTRANVLAQAPFPTDWRRRAGIVRHGFTHFELEIQVWWAQVTTRRKMNGTWYARNELAEAALPTVMRKIIAHAFDDLLNNKNPRTR